MENISINFKNIISELKNKNLKLCFIRNRGLLIQDNQNNLYQMEIYEHGSYLDNLIKNGITVEFELVENSISKNIGDWEKEIWDISEVESFIKIQHLVA